MDVDTGVDDAFALLFAASHPDIDLLGVTCVDGNVDVDQVVANTLVVLDAAGASQVPVARGAERPLLNEPRYAREYHGQDGLGDLGGAPSSRRPIDLHAVDFLQRTLSGAPRPVVVIALAPLTNIALLLRMYPRVADKIERLVLMGGSVGQGNATATAEFNVWHDPEAAAVAFRADIPITMYGLDVYYDVTVSADQGEALSRSPNPAAQLASRLIGHQIKLVGNQGGSAASTTLGDYGAVATFLDPDGATIESAPVSVVTSPGLCRGQTIVDLRADRDLAEPDCRLPEDRPVDVVTAVDGQRYASLWLTTLGYRGSPDA
jgi:pyrimidine-specific ribonucleoside hydrolase